ncbi:MAG: GNAT family N-acetyltransferase [Victivallales bacterium]
MIFRVLNKRNIGEWAETASSFPADNLTIFHTPEYLMSWEDYESADPICLYMEENGTKFLYPFLKKGISGYSHDNIFDISSAYGYGGVVSSSVNPDSNLIQQVNHLVDEWCKSENIIAEFIREYPAPSYIRNSEMTHVRNNLIFHYDGFRENYAGKLKKRAVRDAKSSVKKGCEASIDLKLDSLGGFINLYKNVSAVKEFSGFYNFNMTYFNSILKYLRANSFIINIAYNGKTVASSLNFAYGDSITYHLSASDYDFKNLLPNDLMLFTLIDYGGKNGYNHVFLGGGLSEDENDPLFLFKEKYATNTVPVHIGKKIHNGFIYDAVCDEWANKYPDKKPLYSKFFLKYRF